MSRAEAMPRIDLCMSNCDHSIDDGLDEALRADPTVCAHYAGWNFSGSVWFKDGKFHCEVMCYHQVQETITADTLEDIMQEVSDQYGWD